LKIFEFLELMLSLS